MFFKNIVKQIIILFCLILFPLSGYAQDIVIMTNEWHPYVSSKLKNYGFTAEIISQAFVAAGIKPVIEFAPWSRCEACVKNGKIFAAFPYTMNEDRTKFALFSKPVGISKTLLFYNFKKNRTINYSSIKDLKPFLLGGVRGYFYEPLFAKAGLSVDYSENEEACLKKLFYKRIDIVPINEFVGCKILNDLFPDKHKVFATCKTALSVDDLSLMVSKKYPDAARILQQFNKGLSIIINNGLYNRILTKNKIYDNAGCSCLK